MKSTDNKKAQHLQAAGLIDVNLKDNEQDEYTI